MDVPVGPTVSVAVPPTGTNTQLVTSTPTATATPPAETIQKTINYPVEFPLPILRQEQIQEVADCHVQELANERYPENIDTDHLLASFPPVSDCDWAVLSFGYAVRNDSGSPSPLGLEAFKKAISKNYGFALATGIFDYYFSSVPLVNTPQFTGKEIEKVEINYIWNGLGEPSMIEYALDINQANTNPIISSKTDSINTNITLDKNMVQDLSQGLNDLLPVDSGIQLIYCTDNYPEWSVSLTFTDGTKLDLESSSNYIGFGGPWQTKIDGQTYIQYSPAFAIKMSKLVEELELPLGKPMGMFCPGGVVFENAFSRFLPPSPTPGDNPLMEVVLTAAAQTVEVLLTQTAAVTPTP